MFISFVVSVGFAQTNKSTTTYVVLTSNSKLPTLDKIEDFKQRRFFIFKQKYSKINIDLIVGSKNGQLMKQDTEIWFYLKNNKIYKIKRFTPNLY